MTASIFMNKTQKSILIGLSAGFLSGLLGIGGGLIFVPALVFFLSFDQHQAHGTSLAAIIPAALVGSISYAWHGYMDIPVVLWLIIGSSLGAYLGSSMAIKMPASKLKVVYGIFLILIAIKLIIVW